MREKPGRTRWWTFAGLRANATLADALTRRVRDVLTRDNLSISFDDYPGAEGLTSDLEALRGEAETLVPTGLSQEAADGLKFSYCLPDAMALQTVQARLTDAAAVRALMTSRIVSAA